jgi:hypothetical protein
MRGHIISALAASLLLSGGGADGVAPRSGAVGKPGCASLGSADCGHLLQKLATFAAAAYGEAGTASPPPDFQPADLAGVTLSAGRYTNGSATALVMAARFDQSPVLVVGFGGSSDPATWLADLRDINGPYRQFLPLVHAIEGYAAAGGRVVLVGHSFGGAMVQLFMFAHPVDPSYRAVTFGSPGARPAAGVFAAQIDPRITNFVIADDPYVFLGEHRADVADQGRRNRLYALVLAGGIAQESGLSIAQVIGAEPYLTANYLNNGGKVILPGNRSGVSLATIVRGDPQEHAIETYVKLLAAGKG